MEKCFLYHFTHKSCFSILSEGSKIEDKAFPKSGSRFSAFMSLKGSHRHGNKCLSKHRMKRNPKVRFCERVLKYYMSHTCANRVNSSQQISVKVEANDSSVTQVCSPLVLKAITGSVWISLALWPRTTMHLSVSLSKCVCVWAVLPFPKKYIRINFKKEDETLFFLWDECLLFH